MIRSSKIIIIINPNAASRSAGKQWMKIRSWARKRLGPFETRITSRPGEAMALTRQAVLNGASRIVCMGGDGTLNETINGLMGFPDNVRKDLRVGFIPCGTGCDFARTMPISRNALDAVDAIAGGKILTIDIGKLHFRDRHGKPATRFFHNVASFGLGGEVDRRINQRKKFFGPTAFFHAALQSMLNFGKKKVYLEVDNRLKRTFVTWNVAIANGQYHGAGMRVAPGAKIDDGLFQITIIGDMSIWETALNVPRLYSGNICASKIRSFAGTTVLAASRSRVPLDIDGEYLGTLPLIAELIPQALNFMVSKR